MTKRRRSFAVLFVFSICSGSPLTSGRHELLCLRLITENTWYLVPSALPQVLVLFLLPDRFSIPQQLRMERDPPPPHPRPYLALGLSPTLNHNAAQSILTSPQHEHVELLRAADGIPSRVVEAVGRPRAHECSPPGI